MAEKLTLVCIKPRTGNHTRFEDGEPKIYKPGDELKVTDKELEDFGFKFEEVKPASKSKSQKTGDDGKGGEGDEGK